MSEQETTVACFRPGDRVEHDGMGPGVVEAVTVDGVAVRYDRTYRGGGRHGRGLYDDNWFRTHPGKLWRTGDAR
jgi:hypothetical protein